MTMKMYDTKPFLFYANTIIMNRNEGKLNIICTMKVHSIIKYLFVYI